VNILVTGASGALGSALVTAYANRNDRVFAFVRSENQLEAIPTLPGVVGAVLDFERSGDLEARLDGIDTNWLELDAIVHAASSDDGVGPAWELSTKAWQDNFAVNVLAIAALVRRAAPGMIARRNGVVIGVVSFGARVALPWLAPYCVSKAALQHYILCIAKELAPHGVRANALEVSFGGGIFARHQARKAATGYYRDRSPSSPPNATVADNLEPFLFLTSEAARHVTGQYIECSGLLPPR